MIRQRFGNPFLTYRVEKAKTRPTNSGRAVMNGVMRCTHAMRDFLHLWNVDKKGKKEGMINTLRSAIAL